LAFPRFFGLSAPLPCLHPYYITSYIICQWDFEKKSPENAKESGRSNPPDL
jgi:hypothetical protein